MRWFGGIALALAQSYTYGDEWYNPNLTYRKLLTWADGVYRVYGSELNLPPTAHPDRLHLIFRGREVPMYVYNAGDPSVFEATDYVEFWGQQNDGWVDTPLYRHPLTLRKDPNGYANPFVNLNTDTAAYFLTWDNTPGLRLQEYQASDLSSLPLRLWGWYASQRIFGRGSLNASYFSGPGGLFVGGYEFHNNPQFISGEGWGGSSGTFSTSFPTPYAVPTATPFSYFEARHATTDFSGGHTISWKIGNHTPMQYTFYAPALLTPRFAFPTSALSSPTTAINFTLENTYSRSHVFFYYQITYPRAWQFDTSDTLIYMGLKANGTAYRLELQNFPADPSSNAVFVYDFLNGYKIPAVHVGGIWQVGLPAGVDSFALTFVRQSGFRKVRVVTPQLAFWGSSTHGADFVIITHRSLASSAAQYATYRDTFSGNPLRSVVVFTDEIYDEFGYGSANATAIRNFCKAALDRWNPKPRFFLLWGEAFWWARASRFAYKLYPNYRALLDFNLVPSFGHPSSDYGYVSDFYGDGDLTLKAAIGRVTVFSNQEGEAYLAKIRAYEQLDPAAAWLKWGVHLGGGENLAEQSLIGNYLQQAQSIFEAPPYGGRIVYYQKSSGGMQPPPGAPSVQERVDSGVVILQTFGHSAGDLFDVALYEPVEYQNYGRPPFIIVNGCYQGGFDYASPGGTALNYRTNHGERFILLPQRGCIAYMAGSGSGFIGPLGVQTRELYRVLFRDSLHLSVGRAIQEMWKRRLNFNVNAFDYYHLCMSNLLGDPAVRLQLPQKPDLAISSQDMEVASTTLESDSFYVGLRIWQRGLLTPDSFTIQITHRALAAGQSWTYRFRKAFYAFKDSFVFRLPLPRIAAGPNALDVFVDAEEEIPELREDNNTVRQWGFYISSPKPLLLYPWEFAVINKDSIGLIAGTYQASTFSPQGYYFEIDTSYLFNSPFVHRSPLIQGTTVYGQWVLPFRLQDSVVYYWRARLAGQPDTQWAYASFQYLPGDYEGWGQSRLPQFKDNRFEGLKVNLPYGGWSFVPFSKLLEVNQTPYPGGERKIYMLDGNVLNGAGDPWFPRPCIFVGAIEPKLLTPYYYPNYHNYWRPLYFDASNPQPFYDSLLRWLSAFPPQTYVVLLLSPGHTPSTWPALLRYKLESVGASPALWNLTPNQRYVALGRVGAAPATALEVITPDSVGAYLRTQLTSNFPVGRMESPPIPPAFRWYDYLWKYHKSDGRDTAHSWVIGQRADGTQDTLYAAVGSGTYSLTHVQGYSTLRLKAILRDTLAYTAPPFRYWYVFFEPLPDFAVDPTVAWRFVRDTVQEGETLSLVLGLKNLSYVAARESIYVEFWVRNAQGGENLLATRLFRPLGSGDTLLMHLRFSSVGLVGANLLRILVNPGPRQAERTLANNYWEKTFYVRGDEMNPIVDVLFDGRKIQDGDIVSPSPLIVIEAKDENRYLLMQDTSSVEVRLRKADERSLGERIFYASGKLRFSPATSADNRARIEYRPDRLENGEYILSVQAWDKSRNRSGNQPYQVRFRVINESTITPVINFPNPFSTATRFYYELTGSELPEVFQIHIYTMSGRLVKVIDLKALGEVRIGRNVTAYAWDGTDEFGDRLANGVYLYRVVIRMPGSKALPLREVGAEKYFEKGWGKMVLMR
ncbi:MAG: putative type IX secretion system sortase PorU2 [Bacteroidia bacterium]